MIPNQWYVILESKEVKSGKIIGVTRFGEKLVLWRDSHGRLSCLSDQCPHRGVALSAGKIKGDCIQCPFHGFEYDVTGRCKLIPANGRNSPVPKAFQVRNYPVREAHDLIYVWYGEPAVDLPPVPWIESINESEFSFATLRDPWATHYSRAIENQLDVLHLPFVHYNTIGRGNRTLVNGPLVEWEEKPDGSHLMSLWVYNEIDQGQTPLKPSEIPSPERHPFLQFRFPNLWQNWISDEMRILIAFVPVDDENTLMYIRVYQKITRLPVIQQLFNWMSNLGNLYIERQDRRVVVTQRPKRTDLRISEKLVQGDGPVIEYRRRRAALIEAASQRKIETVTPDQETISA